MSGPERLWTALSLRCEQASELESRRLDEPLDRIDEIGLWGHRLACACCRRVHRQLERIRDAARLSANATTTTTDSGIRMSPEFRERMARLLAEARGAGPSAPESESDQYFTQ